MRRPSIESIATATTDGGTVMSSSTLGDVRTGSAGPQTSWRQERGDTPLLTPSSQGSMASRLAAQRRQRAAAKGDKRRRSKQYAPGAMPTPKGNNGSNGSSSTHKMYTTPAGKQPMHQAGESEWTVACDRQLAEDAARRKALIDQFFVTKVVGL